VPDRHPDVSDKRPNEECNEGQLADSKRHAVHLDVDQRESLEPGVEDGIDKTLRCMTSVKSDQIADTELPRTNDEKVIGKNNSLGEIQDEGFYQCHLGGIAKGHLGLCDFSLGPEIFVASELPEPLRTSQKDILRRSLQARRHQLDIRRSPGTNSTHLGKEESQEESGSSSEPQHDPECPTPTVGLNGKPGDNRSKTGSTGSGNSPNTKGESPRLDRVHILQRGSTSSEGRRTEKSSKETKDTQPGKVGHKGSRDL
jgi:hypothetical protein